MNSELRIKTWVPKISLLLLVCFLVVVPVLVNAQLLPQCGRTGQPECGFGHLIELVNNVIRYLILISIPVAAAVFAWAGFNMMTHPDNPGARTDSWKMIQKVFIGLVLILAAWLITNTLKNALVGDQIPSLIGN